MFYMIEIRPPSGGTSSRVAEVVISSLLVFASRRSSSLSKVGSRVDQPSKQVWYRAMLRKEAAVLVIVATWLIVLVDSGVILRDENEVGGSEDEIDLTELGLDLYGEPDMATGKLVENYDPDKDGVNPEELGSYVEGDILINRPAGRNGMADKSTRWPGGVVPFVISGNFQISKRRFITDPSTELKRNVKSNVACCVKAGRDGG
ncbi:hypothetical protein RP20_CCG019077 [Aedes albopictus]|nr:hypothetical protein RP20_CCG019077 [Aedes albopictus]